MLFLLEELRLSWLLLLLFPLFLFSYGLAVIFNNNP